MCCKTQPRKWEGTGCLSIAHWLEITNTKMMQSDGESTLRVSCSVTKRSLHPWERHKRRHEELLRKGTCFWILWIYSWAKTKTFGTFDSVALFYRTMNGRALYQYSIPFYKGIDSINLNHLVSKIVCCCIWFQQRTWLSLISAAVLLFSAMCDWPFTY